MRHRGPLAVTSSLIPALLLVLAVAACGTPVAGTPIGTPVPGFSAADAAREALLDLAEAGVVHYTGGLTTAAGTSVGLDVRISSAGEVDGTITLNSERATVVAADGAVFVDAPPAFFSALAGDPGSAPTGTGRWAKVTASALGIDIGGLLGQATLGPRLAGQVNDSVATPLDRLPATTVGGTPAVRVDLADGTVWLAAAAPHGVLRIDVPADVGSTRDVSLTVADATPSEAAFYQDLLRQGPQLGAAIDTSVSVQQGNQAWGPCSSASCSVVVTFTNTGGAPARVVVDGTWTGDGQPAGTCEVIAGPVPSGQPANATCTDSTPDWAAFASRAQVTPGQHRYQVDWTARALAAPPDLSALTEEAADAARPTPSRAGNLAVPVPGNGTGAAATVYVLHYQDDARRPVVWRFGVADTSAWRSRADTDLVACRVAARTSCSADPVSTTGSRPSADALAAQLVAAAKATSGTYPPGQWVDVP